MGKVWKRRWLRNKVAKVAAAAVSDAPVASSAAGYPAVPVEAVPEPVVSDAPVAPVAPVEAAPEPVVEEEVVVPQKRVRRARKTKGKE